jgi:acetyl esterase
VTDDVAAEPLYSLIRRVRHPLPLRELMAACLRSIYRSDPFNDEQPVLPPLPEELIREVEVNEHMVSGIRCVIYSPKKVTGKLPFMLYMHGGGFVIGCSDDTDYVTRMLCHSNQMVVISINYRLAPETMFPGALIDCETVLRWAITMNASLEIDQNCLYLAGDSAGANLAAASWFRLLGHRQAVRGLVLLAPWLDMEVERYESYNRLAPEGFVFDSAFLAYARAAYARFEQWKNPSVSPLFVPLADLPPTIALIDSEDPLVDQTRSLEQLALTLGCDQIQIEMYKGMPHCFYVFPTLFNEERDCFLKISEFITRTSK